ncbi:protein wech [Amyelois transitella]|uniref:protein wech n=1 Tax=Amyelois transitella TaxID=680683 RepID=UPI00067CC268|nr:protein wech [Amyelois transitella]
MTSITNLTHTMSSNQPSTSTGSSNSSGSNDQEDQFSMSQLIRTLLENMHMPSQATGASTSAAASSSSSMSYDIWAMPSTSSVQNLSGTNRESAPSSSNQDNSSGSPGTSSNASITCYRCEERAPTNRCRECNDLFCYECCHKVNSECQLRQHTLLPINHISPIGVGRRSMTHSPEKEVTMLCELHNDQLKFYCEACIVFICQECTLWVHKDHAYSPIRGALNLCRFGVIRVMEDTKTGTKAIKAAIDRAVAMSKAYEKETVEANMKIRKAMRCYAQAIEDREKYLLDKVEKMRQAKLAELTDHMNTLRGILAGLAHTNETMLRCMDSDGLDLFMCKEKGRAQVDYFSTMFKSMNITEENIFFTPPNYELVDFLKMQCEVQSLPAKSFQAMTAALASGQFRQFGMHPHAAPGFQGPVPLGMPVPRCWSEHGNSGNYYEPGFWPFFPVDGWPARGFGQAIPGYWNMITIKPTRHRVPGVPMFSFGREGQDDGQVSRPWGLCIDREGNIIVADRRNNRIQIFNSQGCFKTMFGCKGTGPGEFDLPAGITTDSYGRIIVVDKDNHRVQIFTPGGNFILKFGAFGKECGQFQYPWDVAVNSIGNIVVTDTRNHRIQMFTADGSYLTKFVFEGANPSKMVKGPTTPRGVCFTTTGNIIVSDFENHRLILVDSTLSRVLYSVGREGSAIGELNRPSGIVTDDEGNIVVADSKNHRVVVYGSDLRILCAVDLKSPGLDDKDRPSDVALTPEGFLVVLFETLPDTARDISSHGKQYIKVY